MGFRNPTLALRCPGPAPLPLPRPMSTRKRLRPRPPGSAVPEGLLCVSVQVDAHSCPRHLVRRGRNTPWLGIRHEGCLPRTSSVSDSSQKPPVRGGPAPTPGGLVNRLSEFMGELAVTPSPSAGQGSPPRLFWGCPPPSPAGGPALVSAQAVTSGNPRRPALGGARTGPEMDSRRQAWGCCQAVTLWRGPPCFPLPWFHVLGPPCLSYCPWFHLSLAPRPSAN